MDRSAAGLRPRGVVATPAPLARRLAWGLSRGRSGPPAVLDPACGDGALLLAALEEAGGAREYARTALHGFEIDSDLAARARERLCRRAGLPDGALDERIRCADALAPELEWPAGTCVLANPPWLSFSGRQAESLSPPARQSLRRSWASFGGWPSLQGAFLERIARHLGDHLTRGRLLLPASVTELEGYGPLRRAVTKRAELAGPPEELGEGAFPGVVEPAVLLDLSGRPRSGPGSSAPWTARPEADRALLERLEAFPRLPELTFADPGVHTGNSARELVLREAAGGWPGVREGRCLRAFRLDPPRAWLRTDLLPSPERRFRIGPLERYRSFPILLRQTADRPLAALHVEPTYFRNSLLAAREVPDLDPAALVAILNGPVATAWHRLMHRDARQRAFPQVKVSHLAGQPMPIASRAEDPRLHDELAGRVRALEPGSLYFEAEAAGIDALVLEAFDLAPADAARVRALAAGSLRLPS